MRSIPALVLAAAFSTPALGATIKVPGDEDNVQDALVVAGPGDTIKVSKGVYPGFTVDGKTGIRIKGSGNPTINSDNPATILVVDSQDIVIEGLILTNPAGKGVEIRTSTDVTIQKCTIIDVDTVGVHAHGGSGAVIQKNRIGAPTGVSLEEASPAGPNDTSRVAKNRFEGSVDGVRLSGDGNIVEKNRFEDMTQLAVRMTGTTMGALVSKNRVERGGTGIGVDGSNHRIEKNKLKDLGGKAIDVEASNSVVEKNKIDGAEAGGIDVRAHGNQLLKNSIKNVKKNGINLGNTITGTLLEKNKILKAEVRGVYIGPAATGNTLIRNKASKSGNLDLFSVPAEGLNTFVKNKFGTIGFE